MAVSFSASAKAEVCRIFPNRYCCALAECFGILLFCNSFQPDGIKIITESREFAYILPKLFKKAFNLNFDSYPSLEAPGKLVFQIWEEEKIDVIMESFGFDPEMASRSGAQVLYFKQSEQISDFLTYLGAPVAAMGIMEARLEKELNNKVNRRCNCDDANISKVVEAAQEQLAAIRILTEAGMLENLPGKMRQAAKAREANPAASLTELAAMMDPPITKPAMNNRMKKLVQLAKETVK